MRMRARLMLLNALGVVCTALMVGVVLGSESELRSLWDAKKDLVGRQTDLAAIRDHIGYGGMIHALNSYVLRRDDAQLARFDDSHALAVRSLAHYRAGAHSEEEARLLGVIEEMIDSYRSAMDRATGSDLPPAELDALVRIDDAPYFRAIRDLNELTEREAAILSGKINAELASMGAITVGFGLVSIIVVFGAGGWLTRQVWSSFESRNRDLAEAIDERDRANRAKSVFLANMSHEIRTPLNSILGFSELLIEDENDRPACRSHVETIRRNGIHLMHLVDELLDISRIEAGRVELAVAEVCPVGLIEEAVSMIRPKALAKGLRVHTIYSTPMPGRMLSDPTRLRQVLFNLLGNAVKFTNRGAVTIEARYAPAGDDSGRLTIAVRDTGPGMNPEQLARVFRRFEQADNSATRRHGGVGLGLSISQSIIELMGGRLTAASTPGEGSEFVVALPAKTDGTLDARVGQDRAEDGQAPSPAPAGIAGALDGLRVLVVEDGLDNQRLVCSHLQHAGAIVAIAENGQEAIDVVDEQGPFDVILMDMQMPIMDGCTATRRLRARGYDRPVIALTAHAMVEDRLRFLESGCQDVLTKPVTRADLVGGVRSAAGLAA